MKSVALIASAACLLAALAMTPAEARRSRRAEPAPTLPVPTLEPTIYAMKLEGRIEIGTDGTVLRYEPVTPVAEPLAARVREAVARFRFEPIVERGKPVTATARMWLNLVATPRADGDLDVSIEHVGFPSEGFATFDGTGSQWVLGVAERAPLQYPVAAFRADVSGRVVVAVRVGRDGRVLEALPRASAVFDRERDRTNATTLAKGLGALEGAAVDAIRRWRFDVRIPDGVTPAAEELTVLIPVEWRLEGHRVAKDGVWLRETRSAERTLPWLEPMTANAIPALSVVGKQGHAGLPSPRLRLLTPVAGTAL